MKCNNPRCKRTIQDNSIYCNWCGTKQIREVYEIVIPKPTKTKDGYSAQVMIDKKRVRIKGKTEQEYRKNVIAAKAGDEESKSTQTLKYIITDYINSNSATLSPATLRGYDQILRCRFKEYINLPVNKIDFQKLINEESKIKSPKTVKNGWGLVTASLNYAKIKVPEVNLPAIPESDEDFLDHKQVKKFLEAIKGDSCEIPALLALHSLRASEMYHLEAKDISKDGIIVRGSTVRDKDNKWVDKDTNKNRTSTRTVPIIIPRLLEIIPSTGRIVIPRQTTVREHIETICIKNRLPVVTLHDLRRTYASLAAYLQLHEEYICATGGWKTGSPVVHKIYIKVSNKTISEDTQKMKRYLKITQKKNTKAGKACS